MMALYILANSIIHAHTYVIVVICVPVATYRHIFFQDINSTLTLKINNLYVEYF
jgi:hypothetical protein